MIQRRERRKRDGTEYVVWRVRWHEPDGAERSRTFDRRADAVAYEATVRLAKRAGDLAPLDAGRETLATSPRSGGSSTPRRTFRPRR